MAEPDQVRRVFLSRARFVRDTPASATIESRTRAKREVPRRNAKRARPFFRSTIVGRGAIMKTLKATVLVAAMGLAGMALADPSRVTVSCAPADQLTAVKQNPMDRGQMRTKDWESALSTYLQKRADRQLPPGQRLDVTFDDIKLAGDYEPWHSPQAQDIRFMKDIYPPRATLSYKLTDADGRTIKEGSSKLLDMAYMQRPLPLSNTDPLRFDNGMLADWLKKE